MKRWQRTILFWFLFLVFLIFGPSFVLYSQGYRFDFEKKIFTKTGGIFIKALPKEAEIFLNGNFVKKTDFLFGSALIQNLLPKKYEIEIKKEGFFSWKKNLEVKEKVVTEAKNVILFPKELSLENLASGIENFLFSPDGKKIILIEKDNVNWEVKLLDLEKKLETHLIKKEDILKKETELIYLEFSENPNILNLKLKMGKETKNFTLDFSKTPPVLEEIKGKEENEGILAKEKKGKDIFYLDTFGNLFKNQEKISQLPFPIEPKTNYSLKLFLNEIFLLTEKLPNEKDCFIFNKETGSFEKIFEKIEELKLSPDNKKLAVFSQFEIWIFNLETKEKFLLSRFSKEIKDLFWFNSDYLIFTCEDVLKVSEIDNRDRINIVKLGEFENPRIFWNDFDKRIYILEKGNLFSSQLFKF